MNSLRPHYQTLLERTLSDNFIPHLPPLIDQTRPAEEQQRKNLSRAFSAFALHRLCHISQIDAAKAVIDDFDDNGIDAIYYMAGSETLYIIQAKLKVSDQFRQEEALAFCQGIRKILNQDFSTFNQNFQNRLIEIEDAFVDCSHIQLVVAHTGPKISEHAKTAIKDLIEEDHGEERFIKNLIDYNATEIVKDLQSVKAYERVDADLWIQKCSSVNDPRTTYFGLIQLNDLVKLHQKHDKALYDKNIRTFLGHKTDVNKSIRQTLANNPKEFLYLNNGVALLCQKIEPKGSNRLNKGRKKLKIKGLSVINGAQTIASAAFFLHDNDDADISEARVSITLIKASADGDFGKSVTRARNHQNPIFLSNFVALDDGQERLRRELAHLHIHYAYKAEAVGCKADPQTIGIEEAAQALALFQNDPRFVVWLKNEPGSLLDIGTDQYKELFPSTITAIQLANAVRFLRYVQLRTMEEGRGVGPEHLSYRHGNHAIGWVLAKRIMKEQQGAKLLDDSKLRNLLGVPFDQLRQIHWTETQKRLHLKGPLALFRNQTETIPLLETILISYYRLESDPALGYKSSQHTVGSPYPKELFDYLISKAPQIGNLS
ncbi:MAG: abortive phage resistance protein [Desulfobacteraceae bacterium]|nr:MAG: abortive phage resistance protein [Desulfobacteraceae bacterium]